MRYETAICYCILAVTVTATVKEVSKRQINAPYPNYYYNDDHFLPSNKFNQNTPSIGFSNNYLVIDIQNEANKFQNDLNVLTNGRQNFDNFRNNEQRTPAYIPQPQVYFPFQTSPTNLDLQGGNDQRIAIAQGLLTFGPQPPPPSAAFQTGPVLLVRQIQVTPLFNTPPRFEHLLLPRIPQKNVTQQGRVGIDTKLLTFGPPLPPPPGFNSRNPLFQPQPIPIRVDLTKASSIAVLRNSSPLINRLRGPIALGSGSISFVRLPGGGFAAGSGALGYAGFDISNRI